MSTVTTSSKRIKTSKSSKAKQPSASSPPLGKFLASSEKHIRDKAVASLSKFLSAGHRIGKSSQDQGQDEEEELIVGELDWDKETKIDKRLDRLEMAKLWKGIFFCFWMSDKPLVQQALAQDLANLTLDVRPKSKEAGRVDRFRAAMSYLRGFWEAVVREWSGLDRLRLDKFYLLIRRFIHVAFLLLQREHWDPRAIAEYNRLLTGPGGPLHVTDARIPASIAYHIADIYLAEVERACPSSPESTPSLPLLLLLQPILTTLALAPSKTLFLRITENVTTPLLDYTLPLPEPKTKRRKVESTIEKPTYPGILSNAIEGSQGSSEDEKKGKIGKALLKGLFEEGGKMETTDVNRRRIYEIVKLREESGIEL